MQWMQKTRILTFEGTISQGGCTTENTAAEHERDLIWLLKGNNAAHN